MPPKKKYTVLNMHERLEVLKDLQENSLSILEIGRKYGVDAKTIQRIKKNAAVISTFVEKSMFEKERRKLVGPVYDELGQHLLTWFTERRTLGDRLTDALILEKATELKNTLPSCSNFKLSRGWLAKFKRRHGIRIVNIRKEQAKVIKEKVDTFNNNLKKLIAEKNISIENIYNMAETRLVWKALPTSNSAGEQDKIIRDYKLQNDKITIALCTNALGINKIMPLVIYKYKNPSSLKHEVSLPIIFKSQVNAMMDQELFIDWFENHFKPSVREYQDRRQLSGKVILLVDDREVYKLLPQTEEDECFEIMYLPADISAIQPMTQGITQKTKRMFRYKLLQRVLTYDGINEFYRDYSLKNCIDILTYSWQEITQNDIRYAWSNIIGQTNTSNHILTMQPQPDWQDMLRNITGEECTEQHVIEFLLNCEEAEDVNEEEAVTTTALEEEPLLKIEEPSEIVHSGNSNETAKNELENLFDALSFYSDQAPAYIQYMVQGLKTYFLSEEY
nr:PREDICTED: jerky protein homolog-like isoform X1 [Megachile rotundata]